MDSILLSVVLYALGAIAGIWFGIHSAKNVFTLNSSNSTTMLGDGQEKAQGKAQILEKERAKDPINANNSPATNTAYGQPQLPDMRGVDYGNVGMGGGMGLNAMIGVVNAVGLSTQSGAIKNTSVAGRHITGPVRQMGMIYNVKPKGTKSIQQLGSPITNTIARGRLSINQNGNGIKTSIAEGRTDVKPLGNSKNYISGNVKSLKAGQGDIYTPNLKINGVSKAGSLYAQNFIAPKSMRKKLKKLKGVNTGSNVTSNDMSSGLDQQTLLEGENTTANKRSVIINLNTIKLLNNDSRKYTSSTSHLTKTLSLEEAFGDPQNETLTSEQKVVLAGVYRKYGLIGDDSYKNMLKQVIQEGPNIKEPEKIVWLANRAPEFMNRKIRHRQTNAELMTNKRNVQKDLQNSNMNYLNNMIRSDGTASGQINHFVEESYRKKVEQKARANIEKRSSDMSLEEIEKEYEEEVKKIMGGGNEKDKEAIEEHIKQQILADPEEAKKIIGEEKANDIKKHAEEEREKVYQRNLEKQENVADSEFKKSNPEYKDASSDELREARIKSEVKESINQAIEELSSQSKQSDDEQKERKIKSYEEYIERRRKLDEQYKSNIEGNTSMPTGSSTIYIPRAIQEQMARKVSNSD